MRRRSFFIYADGAQFAKWNKTFMSVGYRKLKWTCPLGSWEICFTKANKLGDLGVWRKISACRYGVVFRFKDILE